MRLDSANMTKQLEASRAQIEGLRLRLERAQEVGLQDPLTLVGNRRCFDVALAIAIKAAETSTAPLSIVMGDLDRFKSINDQYGHQVGDEVLKFFTQLMSGSIRDGDTVARFGGEEFAIILPQCSGHEASSIAERIRLKLSAKSLTIRRTSQDIGLVTASFGVAQLLPGEAADSLIARSDGALYTAKKSGRNRVSLA
jgi:diguanylate cyclase